MKNSISLIATALVAAGASLVSSAAQAETLFWNGENQGFCVIEVEGAGLLTPDDTLSTLSSQNAGGQPVNFTVTTNDNSILDDQFENELAVFPDGFNPSDAVMEGQLALSGATSIADAQQQASTLNVGVTTGAYDMSLATSSGDPLQAGAYQVRKEITCTPTFQGELIAQDSSSSSSSSDQPQDQ